VIAYAWTAERVDRLIVLMMAGKSYSEVSLIMGCKRDSIAGKLSRMRLSRDPRLPAGMRQADKRYQRNTRAVVMNRAANATKLTDVPPPIAPRDPCFRCGVRRDVGCVHTAWEMAA
jgi:GcrA cell cycle regulator